MNAKTGGGLAWRQTGTFIFLAAASFHLAFATAPLAPLIAVYFWCLVELTRIPKGSAAFLAGLTLGLLVFVPKVTFFFNIFGAFSIFLWLILALWHGLFLHLGSMARRRFAPLAAIVLLPILWTGLEYFRSELYSLRFSWMAGGYAFALEPNILLSILGVYGAGFVLMLAASLASLLPSKIRLAASLALLGGFALVSRALPPRHGAAEKSLTVAGMQLEFPVQLEVPAKLDLLKKRFPEAELFVLSEYTFDGPVPRPVKKWCARNSTYLIVGGKDPAGTNYYNTAFVVGPTGEIVFKQVKAVPIQFFQDGLPAPVQKPWDSPWGKIGLVVCYDLSYTRVVDELARQGAQLIIAPTMDVAEWGRQQHDQHALIAPTRAAEYRIPIFRLASSGISQAVSAQGRVMASAPYPGQEETIAAAFPMGGEARLPMDRTIAAACTVITGLVLLFSFLPSRWFA